MMLINWEKAYSM